MTIKPGDRVRVQYDAVIEKVDLPGAARVKDDDGRYLYAALTALTVLAPEEPPVGSVVEIDGGLWFRGDRANWTRGKNGSSGFLWGTLCDLGTPRVVYRHDS